MTFPTATYRIQFRDGMTFDRAVAIVPYLRKLGISHLYASPIFTATTGSTHGYDLTDANEIDPAIGGREGFDRLVAALKGEGLGLILDIVPNHMAASLENGWWKDVIEHGPNSRFARHFDIDWSRRLTLPFLGTDFTEVLEKGELRVESDPQTDKPSFRYHDAYYPLNPASYAGREEELLETTDTKTLSALHDQQHYRLMSWRDAKSDLSYRRFFEVTGLVGVRVEDPKIFDDTHRLILELVRSGAVDGLRMDHVDGLADPAEYLARLRSEVGPDCYLVVEKILGPGEALPADWPVSGTTGYEFIAALSNLFVDESNLPQLKSAYETYVGRPLDIAEELRNAKLLMADVNFGGESARLFALAKSLLKNETSATAFSDEELQEALRTFLVSFAVYRTYGDEDGLPAESEEVLGSVISEIRKADRRVNSAALSSLQDLLRNGKGKDALEFRTRFQQLTGPLMAKSVEDTHFYRQNMALAVNEVGAEPLKTTFSVKSFHAEMAVRRETQPDGLSATSTHDTKRGEDARARLYAITQSPEMWTQAVGRWREMNAQLRQTVEGEPLPEPSVEWMIYQALLGAWPSHGALEDETELGDFQERFVAYLEKALREAKLRTNWGDSNEAYENAVLNYARKMLSPDNRAFLSDFNERIEPFVRVGHSNSLAQTLIKLTAPGVPDVYQGSEGLDLSLVDPDNRRAPDFDGLNSTLMEGASSFPQDGFVPSKQRLIAIMLQFRKEQPELFRKGAYVPLETENGDNSRFVAYARNTSADALIVVACLRPLGKYGSQEEAALPLPDHLSDRAYINLLNGEAYSISDGINIREVVGDIGVAALRRMS
jgi:(1->4)-alpha-D-glucan 1-alpha-D-glucosylmutase